MPWPPRQHGQPGDQRAGQHPARHTGELQGRRRQQRARSRPDQVRRIDQVAAAPAAGQRRADAQAAAQEGQRQRQIVEREIRDLRPFPGDAIAVEGQQVDRRVSERGADHEPAAGQGQQPVRRYPRRPRGQAQERAAGPEAEQRQADHQEREVIELRDGQEPRQRAFEEERGRGQRRHTEGSTAKHPLTIVRQNGAAGRGWSIPSWGE